MSKTRHPREELKHIIADGKPEYVRELFDTIATDYDRMNRVMTGGLLAWWHRAFLKETGLKQGQRALDVCCGTGDLTFLQARQIGSSGETIGLDFSRNMLAIAEVRRQSRAAQGRSDADGIRWIEGDALDLPFPDGSDQEGFHSVTMGFALRNVGDIGQSIAEMARVTRPGGRVVCLEVSRPTHWIMRAGFNVYFFKIVPILGRIAEKRLSKDSPLGKLRPYTYLPYSLEHLPPPDDILALMQQAGLTRVRRKPLTGGAVSLYIGDKP